jgi:hypothetical protein
LSAVIVTGKSSSAGAVVVLVSPTVVDVVVSGSDAADVVVSDEVEHAAATRAIAARRTDVRINMGCLQSLEEATVAD